VTFIIDTNLILIANGQHEHVSAACVQACVRRLQDVMARGRFAIDDQFLILREYEHKSDPHTGKRPGDQFVRWALQNASNPGRCDQVPLQVHPERGFVSFPDDPQLSAFDPSDRKFIAVANAHEDHPPILQATDSKWPRFAPALLRHGIEIEFICPLEIHQFQEHKEGHGTHE
jgi:hypothetical protein